MTKIEKLRQAYETNQNELAQVESSRDEELLKLLQQASIVSKWIGSIARHRQRGDELRKQWAAAARRAKELGREELVEEDEDIPF